MAVPSSVFEGPDAEALIAAVEGARRPAGVVVAALRELAAEDLVVLGGRSFGSPLPAWTVEPEGRALAVAVGAASARRQSLTWCALRALALGDGRTWEAARAAAAAGLARLVLVVLAGEDQAAPASAALAAAGWSVRPAAAARPWELLSALDRARAAALPDDGNASLTPGALVVAATPER